MSTLISDASSLDPMDVGMEEGNRSPVALSNVIMGENYDYEPIILEKDEKEVRYTGVKRRSMGAAEHPEGIVDEQKSPGFFNEANLWGRLGNDEFLGKTAAVYTDANSKSVPMSPIKDNPNSRPVDKYGTPTKGIHPNSVITPVKRTQLYKRFDLGSVAIYSQNLAKNNNRTNFLERLEDSKKKPAEHKDEEVIHKAVEMTISLEEIKTVANNRSPSQNQVMGYVSANDEAEKHGAKEFPDQKWEWLHLLAHRFLGKEGQVKHNLVGGTKHANTLMLVAMEQHILELVQNAPVTIQVDAIMKKGTELAQQINYKVSQNGNCVEYKFNATETLRPCRIDGEYTKKHLERILSSPGKEEGNSPSNIGINTDRVLSERMLIASSPERVRQ